MAGENTAPVVGAPAGVTSAAQATTDVTPGQAGVPQGTPGQAPTDAGGNRQGTTPRNPTQQDLDRLRAALQRDANAQVQRVQEEADRRVQALQAQINQLATRGMTDEQRAQFDQQQQAQYFQQLQQQNQQYQQALADQQNRQAYLAYYTQTMGVPLQELNLGGTTDDLVASGWGYIQAELSRLRGGAPAGTQQPAEPNGPPVVPEVVTATNAPGNARSWSDLRQSLGMTEEQIYRAVETGQLSVDIIPTPPA